MILSRMDHPNTVSQAWRVRSSEDYLPGSITSSRISEPSSISIFCQDGQNRDQLEAIPVEKVGSLLL